MKTLQSTVLITCVINLLYLLCESFIMILVVKSSGNRSGKADFRKSFAFIRGPDSTRGKNQKAFGHDSVFFT